MGWRAALCFSLAGAIALTFAVLWFRKWRAGAEVRAIKRRRRHLRA